MTNPLDIHLVKVNDIRIKIAHLEDQRRNTWNLQDRDRITVEIKDAWNTIDTLLDDYNYSKKFTSTT